MTTTTAYGRIKIGYLLNASRTYTIHNTYGAPGLRKDKAWTIFRIPFRKRMLHTSFHIVWWWARTKYKPSCTENCCLSEYEFRRLEQQKTTRSWSPGKSDRTKRQQQDRVLL